MVSDERVVFLQGESVVFSLLGMLLVQAPCQDLLDVLQREKVFEDIPLGQGNSAIEVALAQLSDAVDVGLCEKELADEYLRLFDGLPVPLASLWESGYFNDRGLAFQEQMLDVRAHYRRQALESKKKNREPDDSLALELEFLATLAERAADAYIVGDVQKAEHLLNAHKAFLSEHTLCWIDEWASLVRKYSRVAFYSALADLTRLLVFLVADRFDCVPAHRPLSKAIA